jgi:hypothetical protein
VAKKLNRWFTPVKDGRSECWLAEISTAARSGNNQTRIGQPCFDATARVALASRAPRLRTAQNGNQVAGLCPPCGVFPGSKIDDSRIGDHLEAAVIGRCKMLHLFRGHARKRWAGTFLE